MELFDDIPHTLTVSIFTLVTKSSEKIHEKLLDTFIFAVLNHLSGMSARIRIILVTERS